jgi:serine/threonine-protein kinase HipA
VSDELLALLDGLEVGRVTREKSGRLRFLYSKEWQTTRGAYPISLSMPLVVQQHKHEPIDAYLWGLLPDNENILAKWGQRYHVSPRNAFGLIEKVGEDCAGAIQFVRPERIQDLASENGKIDWLSEHDIAERLKDLVADPSAWRRVGDAGQFSLAGAQAKTALIRDGERWGIPSGRIPTTHILKPPIPDLEGHAENEHFCLELARRLGFAVARSFVRCFEHQIAIVVERYDRISQLDRVVRVHQEDLCQALALAPTRKYEAEGGPGIKRIVQLLRANSVEPLEDANTFIDAIGFNWLIAGTDGHAKNYSVLIGSESSIRLAPIYDIASALPYPAKFNPYKTRLAMKVGGEYRIRNIGKNEWRKLAADVGIDRDKLLNRLVEFAKRLPDISVDAGRQLANEGLKHPILPQLVDSIAGRAQGCLDLLGPGSH